MNIDIDISVQLILTAFSFSLYLVFDLQQCSLEECIFSLGELGLIHSLKYWV